MLHLCSPGLRALCMRQTLYKLRIIPSPWLTGSKVCSCFHLLSFWAFPLSFCSFQPSHYWPYLWVPVDLWIFLWISGSVNLKLLQLNRSVMLAPNSASLSRLQLQFPDTSLFLLVCFDPCLSSTSGSSHLPIGIGKSCRVQLSGTASSTWELIFRHLCRLTSIILFLSFHLFVCLFVVRVSATSGDTHLYLPHLGSWGWRITHSR